MWGAIVGGLVSLVGGLFGAGKDGEANAVRRQIADQYGEDKLVELDRLVAEQAGNTELGGITEDPALRGAQMRALTSMEDVYNTNGMTPADVAALQHAQDAAGGQSASAYQGIQQMLAAQGVDASPGLRSALYSQAGANAGATAGRMGTDFAVQARQRALQALEGMAGLAGSTRGQDYRVSSDRANAQDRINQFNASMRANTNQYNAEQEQQEYANWLAMMQAKGNALSGVASGLNMSGDSIRGTAGGIGAGITTYGRYEDEDED